MPVRSDSTTQPAAATTPPAAPAGQPATATPAAPATANQPDTSAGQTVVAKTDDTVDAKASSYTVAAGRTVHHDGKDYSGARRSPTGESIPGDKVKVDKDDAERLLKGGFILDKDGAAIIHADGPAVNVADGVQIAQPA